MGTMHKSDVTIYVEIKSIEGTGGGITNKTIFVVGTYLGMCINSINSRYFDFIILTLIEKFCT